MEIDAQANFELAGTGELNMDNCNCKAKSKAKNGGLWYITKYQEKACLPPTLLFLLLSTLEIKEFQECLCA